MTDEREPFATLFIAGLLLGFCIGGPFAILLWEPIVIENTIIEKVPVFLNETIHIFENTSVPIRIYAMTQPLNSTFYQYYWNSTFPNNSRSSLPEEKYFLHTITVSVDSDTDLWNLSASLDLPTLDWISWHGIEVGVDGIYFQNVFFGEEKKVQRYVFPEPNDNITFSADRGSLTCAIFGYGEYSPWLFEGFWSGRLTITLSPLMEGA